MKRTCSRTQLVRIHRTGAAMVEMAIVAPLFFLLLFAGIEFSRICLIRNAANNAAYQAARQAMVPGATLASAQQEASRLLNPLGVQVFTLSTDPAVITPATSRVKVTIAVPAKDNGWVAALFSKDLTIQAGSTLWTERDLAY